MSWDLTGNASTNESVNFVGTTDPHALVIRTNGQEAMRVDVNGNVGIGTNNPNSRLEIIAQDGLQIVGYQPFLTLNDSNNQEYATCRMQGANGDIFFHTFSTITLKQDAAMVIKSGSGNVGIGTPTPSTKLHVVGDVTVTGDISLPGGDCAEQFDIGGAKQHDPGTVMVIDHEGTLRESREAYDKKVAGVVSGAGKCRPGIILNGQAEQNMVPIALVGRVYCKVDAEHCAIEVGDLLTTSPTPGHAMKAKDSTKAFGAVIGKALKPLDAGYGLIPILVALQ